MFYYIKGILAHLDLNFAVIDTGGVAYKLMISGTTHSELAASLSTPEPEAKLFTHMAVREDDVELYGFATEPELSIFRMLINVSGVGPKAAMSILTTLNPEKFALAVCMQDTKAISKANGVGAKTAARIVLELHDKIKKENPSLSEGIGLADINVTGGLSSTQVNTLTEAQDALIVLGYTRGESTAALRNIDTAGLDLEAIIKAALKQLMRG